MVFAPETNGYFVARAVAGPTKDLPMGRKNAKDRTLTDLYLHLPHAMFCRFAGRSLAIIHRGKFANDPATYFPRSSVASGSYAAHQTLIATMATKTSKTFKTEGVRVAVEGCVGSSPIQDPYGPSTHIINRDMERSTPSTLPSPQPARSEAGTA